MNSGFKQCTRCNWEILCTNPHDLCLQCLGQRHDSASCKDCQAVTPKAQKQREQQLRLQWLSQAPQSRSWLRHSQHRSSKSCSRRHSDKSSSLRSGKSHKHKKKHGSLHESRSPSRGRVSRRRSPVSEVEELTFTWVDSSPGTKQRYLDRVHKIFDTHAPSDAPPGNVEPQGPLADSTRFSTRHQPIP